MMSCLSTHKTNSFQFAARFSHYSFGTVGRNRKPAAQYIPSRFSTILYLPVNTTSHTHVWKGRSKLYNYGNTGSNDTEPQLAQFLLVEAPRMHFTSNSSQMIPFEIHIPHLHCTS